MRVVAGFRLYSVTINIMIKLQVLIAIGILPL